MAKIMDVGGVSDPTNTYFPAGGVTQPTPQTAPATALVPDGSSQLGKVIEYGIGAAQLAQAANWTRKRFGLGMAQPAAAAPVVEAAPIAAPAVEAAPAVGNSFRAGFARAVPAVEPAPGLMARALPTLGKASKAGALGAAVLGVGDVAGQALGSGIGDWVDPNSPARQQAASDAATMGQLWNNGNKIGAILHTVPAVGHAIGNTLGSMGAGAANAIGDIREGLYGRNDQSGIATLMGQSPGQVAAAPAPQAPQGQSLQVPLSQQPDTVHPVVQQLSQMHPDDLRTHLRGMSRYDLDHLATLIPQPQPTQEQIAKAQLLSGYNAELMQGLKAAKTDLDRAKVHAIYNKRLLSLSMPSMGAMSPDVGMPVD